MENGWTKRIEELEAEVGRLQMMNPCNHTGFESAPCDVCGYPDPRKLIAKLKAENKRQASEALKEAALDIYFDTDESRTFLKELGPPAQERWREEWLKKAEQALKEARDE